MKWNGIVWKIRKVEKNKKIECSDSDLYYTDLICYCIAQMKSRILCLVYITELLNIKNPLFDLTIPSHLLGWKKWF